MNINERISPAKASRTGHFARSAQRRAHADSLRFNKNYGGGVKTQKIKNNPPSGRAKHRFATSAGAAHIPVPTRSASRTHRRRIPLRPLRSTRFPVSFTNGSSATVRRTCCTTTNTTLTPPNTSAPSLNTSDASTKVTKHNHRQSITTK